MIEHPDVDRLMAGPLGEWLSRQEQVRAEAAAKSNRRFAISSAILLPVLALLWFGTDWGGVKFWIGTAFAVVAAAWSYAPRSAAIKETKHGINSALARALGLEYSSDFEPGIGFERAKAFDMLPSYNRSNFEDLWSGEIGGHAFTLHEAHLEQRRQSGKHTHYVTVFRGPIMTIGFSRRFHGTTMVVRAKTHRMLGLFGEKDSLGIDGLRLDIVDMVHPEFEDEFTIYSTDQVEARYLVHPTYVERLIELERAFSGQKIRTLFHQGELTIVLEADDMFESGGMDASRDREMVETCLAQFMSMAGLADALNEFRRQ